MLPKVATTLTRAVTSTYTIRNVIHQSPAPWNSSGSRSGPGSRYAGAGRAVTQAAVSSGDGSFVQADDAPDDAQRPAGVAARPRRSSLSFGGVLKTVQLHARSRHAFAGPTESFEAPGPGLDPAPAAPAAAPAPVSDALARLIEARNSGNAVRAAEAVRQFRQSAVNPSVREFNAAIEALQATRRPGDPLNLMLDTYNDMLRHSLLPNFYTYVALIDTLTARDNEVHQAITALEVRVRHRELTGVDQPAADEADRKRIDFLRRENNFTPAMSLFDTVISLPGPRQLPSHTYTSLIRSCAIHANIDAAIHVFAQQEKRTDFLPSIHSFLEMMRVYTNAGQLSGVEEIFTDYRKALKNDRVHVPWDAPGADPNRLNLLVWNQMIESYFRFDRPDKAVALVEQMLDAKILDQQLIADPPPVSTATFTTVLTGFCHSGDVDTALVWFDRLLAQHAASQDPYEPTGVAMKPDSVAWGVILDALAVKGMIKDLNRLFAIRLHDPVQVRNTERTVVYTANMANLQSLNHDDFDETLTWLREHVLNSSIFTFKYRMTLAEEISTAYLDRKMYAKAFAVYTAFIAEFEQAGSRTNPRPFGTPPSHAEIERFHINFATKFYDASQANIRFTMPLELTRIAIRLRIAQPPRFIPFFLHSYGVTRAASNLPIAYMMTRDWELVLMAADSYQDLSTEIPPPPNFAFKGLPSLIRDFGLYNALFNHMNKNLVRHAVLQLTRCLGTEGTVALLREAGFKQTFNDEPQEYFDILNKAINDSASATETIHSAYASDAPLQFDRYLSKSIVDGIKRSNLKPNDVVDSAFAALKQAVESGRVAHLGALSLLIEWLGRLGRTDDLHFTYSVAQRALQMLEDNKEEQTAGWFQIENAMIIGCAYSGNIEAAQQYRQRIIAHGGAPDGQAYGALIHNIKDTTDDAANALELFKESQTYRVEPNLYLYNNVISKLAKARKADEAMRLFDDMKVNIEPSNVTYGAVIGACARVGDEHSAEFLFSQMTRSMYFKARIPPYNTMMQMYTTVRPNRERALHYYHEMFRVGITPTAHTYKLLLDTYGSIQPFDRAGLEKAWETLKANQDVQSVHYAALLNAYGCVSKDLKKAVEIFDNMEIARDCLVYEAMFNVFITLRRKDLMREYVTKMHLEGVRMTAYVANVLIKGFSLLNNITEARRVFESLEDPPEGVAATNNSPLDMSPLINQSTPVYREPSTWEAMIRAELGGRNRDRATDLLERLKARRYPAAVYNRISGILVEH